MCGTCGFVGLDMEQSRKKEILLKMKKSPGGGQVERSYKMDGKAVRHCKIGLTPICVYFDPLQKKYLTLCTRLENTNSRLKSSGFFKLTT